MVRRIHLFSSSPHPLAYRKSKKRLIIYNPISDYVDQRDGIKSRYGYHTSVRDIVGIFSFNIFVGIAVATIFGSGFFFDLFWPQRHESLAVKKAWKICSVLMCFLTFADAIALTVCLYLDIISPHLPSLTISVQVIVATQRATIDGLTNSEAQQYFDMNGPPNPIYRKNAYCVASVVLLWLGMLGTIARLATLLSVSLKPPN